jgi:oligoribonuclease NrnB/cAMP/cGMP phosphodiesterase (DHH superfamily)
MIYVIYHKNCNDGTASAYAAWWKFGSSAKYIPHMYGEPEPQLPADCEYLYILDYSFPLPIMQKLWKQLDGRMQVIDHHKTAEAALSGFPNCIFDMTQCGAVLSWKFFHPTEKLPLFFEYIQDYDIWTKKLPFIEEASAYINSFERTFDMYNAHIKTFEFSFGQLAKEGAALLRYHLRDVNKIAQSARKGKWSDGTDCMIVNAPGIFAGDVGSKLAKENPDAKFVAVYNDTHDGFRYYSLRSVGDFDVSALAAAYGGGGHKNASGFLLKTPVPLFL